ncbi:MAG: hypothetical protein HRU19_08455 [Pseudobacteriovorax sp.]|nr:hypothetical protein [Pseudobacteriovorax sp.]
MSPTQNEKRKIPQLYLERYALGESNQEERHLIESNMEPQKLTELIGDLQRQNRDYLEKYPFPLNLKKTHRKKNHWQGALPVLAACALLLLFIFPMVIPESPSDLRTERAKGGDDGLVVFKKTETGDIESLSPKSSVKAGDLIQIAYKNETPGYGVIFSLDGNGQYTLHFPANSDANQNLAMGALNLLDFSYELDDAPAFERFIFLRSDQPIDMQWVGDKVSELLKRKDGGREGKLTGGLGVEQDSFLLLKE